MKLEEMLKQQEKRGIKKKKIKAKMQSYEDYVKDDSAPRPYNTPNVSGLLIGNKQDASGKEGVVENITTEKVVRDTKSPNDEISIKDTKNPVDEKPIRDTKSPVDEKSIRDTKSPADEKSIRDTKSLDDEKSIRDTKSSVDEKPIRDTKSPGDGKSTRGEIKASTKNQSGLSATSSKPKKIRSWDDDLVESLKIDRSYNKNSEAAINNAIRTSSHLGRPPKSKTYSYSDLQGNSKKIINEIALMCMAEGSLTTKSILKSEFSLKTGVKLGALKTTISRLKQRGVIEHYEATKGRNSSWQFTLSEKILNEYLSSRRG